MTGKDASSVNGKAQRPRRATPARGDVRVTAGGAAERDDLVAARRELAALQKQVAEMNAQVAVIRAQVADRSAAASGAASLSRMATSIAITLLVGKVVRRLRLGLLGAAAAPLLAAQINHRLWPMR
ncbi:MAG: hypothetical protein KJ947_25910 [Alphaproteobacteria bacterium]|nr:hypothetical protein [Alphaproteobacteria bacterium]MBU1552987.1 hypothetical protein [Alphaproteobacteria bacterium]MBU2338253.1 hypothetical protein [Alphaproteobacteria bacterium]MBU2388232.1 hypothetical protein [Alphaproteobacteria bacterium]